MKGFAAIIERVAMEVNGKKGRRCGREVAGDRWQVASRSQHPASGSWIVFHGS
jgi:hypothetical protein